MTPTRFTRLLCALGLFLCAAIPSDAAVRKQVGMPLSQVSALCAAGDYYGAMAKVNEAQAVPSLTPEELKIIGQMRTYVEVKAGGQLSVSSATSARAKFAADFKAGNYSDVINDVALLNQFDAYGLTERVVVAEAYVRMGRMSDARAQAQKTIAHAEKMGQTAPQVVLNIVAPPANNTAPARSISAPPKLPTVTGALTNDAAQRAISTFFGPGRFTRLDVMGVREFSQENSASADIYFNGFTWEEQKNDAVTAYVFGPGGGERLYTGKATAIFTHYNDGRWVLQKVVTPMGAFTIN